MEDLGCICGYEWEFGLLQCPVIKMLVITAVLLGEGSKLGLIW